jgi:predicted dehydrogenase
MDQALLIRQLLEKGKHVLCTHPLAPTHQKARELVEQSGRSNAELSILSRGIHLDRAVAQALEGKSMGPLLFFNLEVLLNRPAPQEVGQGVVRRGMDCFDWLLRQGGVDTIAARTRNLASSGPAEDVALVQVRLRNGVEGGIQLNGLGQVSKVRLHLYGRDQDLELESDWEYGDELLRAQYQDFASLLEGARRPRPAETRVLESYLLVHWIQQAARLDRPVHRREVA